MSLGTSTLETQPGADGVWGYEFRDSIGGTARPALFLDRDGVIVEEVNYLHRPEDVRLCVGAAEFISLANRQGTPVIVVTNQSGIGRGYYDWPDFTAVTLTINELLEQKGAMLDALYACPFHRDAKPPYNEDNHPGRKPNPGMLERAFENLNLDRDGSWIIGDTADDLAAGRAAGLAGGVHVLTGHGKRERPRVAMLENKKFKISLVANLLEARHLLPMLSNDK